MNKLAPPPGNPMAFTLEEAAASYRISRHSIRKAVASGQIAASKLPGGGIRILKDEMDNYMRSLTIPASNVDNIVDEMLHRAPREARLVRRTKAEALRDLQ